MRKRESPWNELPKDRAGRGKNALMALAVASTHHYPALPVSPGLSVLSDMTKHV